MMVVAMGVRVNFDVTVTLKSGYSTTLSNIPYQQAMDLKNIHRQADRVYEVGQILPEYESSDPIVPSLQFDVGEVAMITATPVKPKVKPMI